MTYQFFIGINIMNKIQYFRELKNLTQEQMAEKLQIAVSTYGKIERGETNLVHKQLRKIATILDVELHQLLPNQIINHFENNQINIGIVQTEHYHNNQSVNTDDLRSVLSAIQSNQEQLIENQKQLTYLLQEILVNKK